MFYEKNVLSEMQIEITRKCNWHCDFCYLGENRDDEMNFVLLKKILSEAKELGCIKVIFTGGEPLMHKNALEIFREAKKMGYICKLNTNASLINRDNYEEISDIISEFFISIHSDKEEVHDYLTQRKGSLGNTINGVRLLKSKNSRVQINTVLTKSSISRFDEIKKFIENDLACEWNPETRIENMQDGNSAKKEEHSLNKEELKLVLMKTKLYKFKDEEQYSTGICLAGRNTCFIDVKGNVYPCLQFKSKQGYTANKVGEKSLKEIWYNDEIFCRIRKIQEEDFSKCLQCANYKRCYKCIANNYIETNEFVCPSDRICERESFYANYNTLNN